jgi:hypothetical protein
MSPRPSTWIGGHTPTNGIRQKTRVGPQQVARRNISQFDARAFFDHYTPHHAGHATSIEGRCDNTTVQH